MSFSPQEQVAWHEQMAKIWHRARLWKSELSHLDRALELDPSLPTSSGGDEIFFQRGRASGELGNYAEAAVDFTRAIQLDPDKIISREALMSS